MYENRHSILKCLKQNGVKKDDGSIELHMWAHSMSLEAFSLSSSSFKFDRDIPPTKVIVSFEKSSLIIREDLTGKKLPLLSNGQKLILTMTEREAYKNYNDTLNYFLNKIRDFENFVNNHKETFLDNYSFSEEEEEMEVIP